MFGYQEPRWPWHSGQKWPRVRRLTAPSISPSDVANTLRQSSRRIRPYVRLYCVCSDLWRRDGGSHDRCFRCRRWSLILLISVVVTRRMNDWSRHHRVHNRRRPLCAMSCVNYTVLTLQFSLLAHNWDLFTVCTRHTDGLVVSWWLTVVALWQDTHKRCFWVRINDAMDTNFPSTDMANEKLSCRREIGRRFVSMCKSLLVFHWNGLYLVPFHRYSASKNGVTLKPGVGVVQGHWKWRRSIDHNYTTFYRSAIVSIALCCTIFEVFDAE